jgi:hypothetical protein
MGSAREGMMEPHALHQILRKATPTKAPNGAFLLWLDRATIQFRFIGPASRYTGSFRVFGPVLSSPAHALISLDMRFL